MIPDFISHLHALTDRLDITWTHKIATISIVLVTLLLGELVSINKNDCWFRAG